MRPIHLFAIGTAVALLASRTEATPTKRSGARGARVVLGVFPATDGHTFEVARDSCEEDGACSVTVRLREGKKKVAETDCLFGINAGAVVPSTGSFRIEMRREGDQVALQDVSVKLVQLSPTAPAILCRLEATDNVEALSDTIVGVVGLIDGGVRQIWRAERNDQDDPGEIRSAMLSDGRATLIDSKQATEPQAPRDSTSQYEWLHWDDAARKLVETVPLWAVVLGEATTRAEATEVLHGAYCAQAGATLPTHDPRQAIWVHGPAFPLLGSSGAPVLLVTGTEATARKWQQTLQSCRQLQTRVARLK